MKTTAAEALARLGKTQDQIAAELEVTRGLVGHWLTGRRLPGEAKRQAIQDRYGIAIHGWDQPVSEPVSPAIDTNHADWGDGSPKAKAAQLERMVLTLLDEVSTCSKPLERAKVMASAAGTLSLLGRLTGETQEISEHRIVRLPAWRRLMARILDALRPYPEALSAVTASLETIETDA